MTCQHCGEIKEPDKKHRKHTYKFCSIKCRAAFLRKAAESLPLPEMDCHVCGKPSVFKDRRHALERKRKGRAYCSKACSDTHSRKVSSETARDTNLRMKAVISMRMTLNNPMQKAENLEKMRSKMVGRTFLARGGNGQPTKQQLALHNATGFPMEHAILTAGAKFPSLPPSYKVDLAVPDAMLAIEVDGKSHRLKKWKFLDRRKTEILSSLGWQVLRFTNEEVDRDLNGCLLKIQSTISTLTGITTTSPAGY